MNQSKLTRRTWIAGAALIPVSSLTGAPQTPIEATRPSVFSSAERRTLDAFLARLVPADQLGPGAVECGAADYIDRCLADYLMADRPTFLTGLASLNALAVSSHGVAFADLAAKEQDSVLKAMESSPDMNLQDFFNRLRRLTLEGMFSDPYWGGNRNFAGWDLIRYPGARLAVGSEDQRMRVAPSVSRRSVYDVGVKHGH